MAETYRAVAVGVLFASGKSMLSLFNASGSGKVLRLYRAWMYNNQTVGVTGVLTTCSLRRITSSSGGTAATILKMDSTNANVPAQITAAAGATDGLDAIFRRWTWSNDEPAASGAGIDELECLPSAAEVWNSGFSDANVEPLVCRANEGVVIRHDGASTVGIADFIFEFTLANS